MHAIPHQVYQRIIGPLTARSAPLMTYLQRRWPRKLIRSLDEAQQIVFVCAGNVIRSAYAEKRLKAMLEGGGPTISSAGLWAHPGAQADQTAIYVAAERQIDLQEHFSRQLDEGNLDDRSVIFVMEPFHLSRLSRCYSSARAESFLITSLSGGPVSIADPIGASRATYRQTFDQIDRCIERMVAHLRPKGPAVTHLTITSPSGGFS